MAKNGNPLISIIIPAFNRAELISETLESVLNQTYDNWECVVVDDGSTDSTLKVVNQYLKIDNRFKFFLRDRNPKGANACRNIGIEKSEGEYVIFLDSDDLLENNCLSRRAKYFEVRQERDFLVFPMVLFRKEIYDRKTLWNIKTNKNDLLRFLQVDTPWQTSQVIWKKKSLNQLNGWDVELHSWQDWDLHVRALLNQLNYEWIFTSPDCFYRIESTETIRQTELKVKHLLKRIMMLEKIIDLTNVKELNYNHSFISLYYLFSKQLSFAGELKQSLSTWRKAKEKIKTPFKLYCWIRFYLIGTYFTRKNNDSIINKILNKLNHIFVDHSLIYHQSKTIKQIKSDH